MSNYTFGNYICELRENRGLSQSQLGEKLGVTNKAISKWENGGAYPSSELMLPLAKALGISIEELYSAIPKSKSEKTKLRSMLDVLSDNAIYIIIGITLYTVTLLVLFVIFGDVPDKNKILMLTPILAVVLYGFIRLMFHIFKKNPMMSSKAIDVMFAVMYILSTLVFITTLMNFVTDFANGYNPSVGAVFGLISGLLLANKKRI